MSITMYYDSDCPLCHTEALKMHRRRPDAVRIVAVDDALAELAAAGISRVQAMTYLCVCDSNGGWHTHMDAVRLLYRSAGLDSLAGFLSWGPVKWLSDRFYPVLARNRYRIPKPLIRLLYGGVCDKGSCRIPPAKR
ncbi:thiol-disulfide oxidoreductase DCC family protein [Neisseria shayeganii]|uniref:DUF393 domain-containing protein n=1 Tax=Neisseria shayeganii TaxID=607712 RepID=A0A7D7SGE5_9NEIS|nr:DUF393 domain-containing protein [Neisseria shayeganii]QMT40032.1 DUF393 domain-containing protein [Neisseria shayeganii]